MREEQLKEDIAMTPLERLTLAFKISDFARELRADNKTIEEESSSIPSVRIPPRALYKLVLKQRKPAVKQAFLFAEEEGVCNLSLCVEYQFFVRDGYSLSRIPTFTNRFV